MLKITMLNLVLIVFLGCGADSDLLRDDTTGGKPSSKSYKVLEDKVYSYKALDSLRVGFEYLSLNEECSTETCYMLRDSYMLFNGESKKLPLDAVLVLSENGWYEKSKDAECPVTFSSSTLTKRCPDGTEQVISISEKNLEGLSIVDELNSTDITGERFKDPDSTFTYDSKRYEFKQKNSHRLFEVLDNDSSKCYSSRDKSELISEDINLSSHSTVVCEMGAIEVVLSGANGLTGSFTINGKSAETNWLKSTVFENYSVIELNVSIESDTKKLFISSYNGTVRIGTILEKESQVNYLNTEAFNAVYTQLNNEYKSTFETYQKLKDNYYLVSNYGGSQGYKQFSVDDEDRVVFSYKDFRDEPIAANWILTEKGLIRESLVCESEFYFHGFTYICEDGRSSEISFLSERTLKNELIDTYLSNQELDFVLENNNRFFSVEAKEFSFKEKSLSGKGYIFNVDGSHNIGKNPLLDDANESSEGTLFVSMKNNRSYAKLIGLNTSDSGSVEIYELNSTAGTNAQILATAKKVQSDTKWKKETFGGKKIIEIINSTEFAKNFNTKKNVAIIEFQLRSQKLISGELYSDGSTSTKKYLNIDGYENILENLE